MIFLCGETVNIIPNVMQYIKITTMKNFLTVILTLLVTYSYGQVDLTDKFKQLYSEGKYEEIIKYKPKKDENLTAKALYYIGMSHYMRSEDKEAMNYLDLAIEKGPVDYDMFYYKGMLYYYASKFKESLPYFDKAIALLPGEPDFHAGKGESYYAMGVKDSAIVYFEKASKLPNCKTRVFLLKGEIYQEQNNFENALNAFKTALVQLTPSDDTYQNCSFNLGLMQQLTGKLNDAKETFENHISAYPTDFHAMAKLIQVYYSLSEFDKAVPFKEKLYAAHKAKKLQEGMKDMFCFDQFEWNSKRIMAFELFNEFDNGFITIKYKFFVTDNKGNIEYTIQSESSSAVRMSEGKYILTVEKVNNHYSYWSYKFNDDFDYKILKEQLIKILNGDIKPDVSTIRN